MRNALITALIEALSKIMRANLTASGFEFDLRTVPQKDIEETILAANTDNNVHGILVYYPIFPNPQQDQYIQQLVAAEKDVEGLSHKYIFNMYQNVRFLDVPMCTQKSILPCTPLACVKVLEYLQIYNTIMAYGNRLFGKTITVINRSEVVGRPLAALLANDGAKVYSVDITGVQIFTRGRGIQNDKHEVTDTTMKLEDCLPLSDVVISGVPSKNYKVDVNLLRDGAVCVNFSSDKNFDAAAVKQQASIYVAAIGKVTIAVLLRNLIVSCSKVSPTTHDWRYLQRLCNNRDIREFTSLVTPHVESYVEVCLARGEQPGTVESIVRKAVSAKYHSISRNYAIPGPSDHSYSIEAKDISFLEELLKDNRQLTSDDKAAKAYTLKQILRDIQQK